MATDAVENENKGGGFTKGRFPRVRLKHTLRLVQAVYELGNDEPVRRTLAFEKLNLAANSGPSNRLVASAVTGYGLLRNAPDSQRFQLTDPALALVTAKSETEIMHVAWEVMSTNPIFRAYVERWVDRTLPDDQVLIDWLKDNHSLTEKDADTCFGVFMGNLGDYNLVRKAGSRSLFESPEMALGSRSEVPTSNGTAHEVPNESDHLLQSAPPVATRTAQAASMAADLIGQMQPQIAFNIQIQLPENALPETYAAIFKNISVYLLGRPEE